MDFINGLIQGASWIGLVLLFIIIALAAGLYFKSRYKVAGGDEALVVTGSKKGMQILRPGAGCFVSPYHRFSRFPLCVMTVRSNDQETQASTLVPIIVKWTAQLRADVDTTGALEKAVIGFSSAKDVQAISDSLEQTLDGEVRAVVATMTPEEVIRNKEEFNTKVTEGVEARMEELGFSLVSLNITEVTDRNSHLHNLAAQDREAKRQSAEITRAETDQRIAVAQARADETSEAAKAEKELAIAEQRRKVNLRQSGIDSETSQARVDADYAKHLREQDREQELAERQGAVEVVRQQQSERAAVARRAVDVANAETRKEQQRIGAEADKEQQRIAAEALSEREQISAEAEAIVARKRAEGQAEASKAKARGEAEAALAKAQGEAQATEAQATGDASATNLRTEAEAKRVRETGLAEAEVAKAQGEAEAAAILEKGRAEAEAQRLMAEALAANDGANLQVTLAEIESTTRVQVATALGTAMHEVGSKATIIDMGGSNGSNQNGGLLGTLLGGIPELAKVLDVKSQALNGSTFDKTIGNFISQATGNGTRVIETEKTSQSDSNA